MLGDTAVAVHPDDERYKAPDRQAACACRIVGRLIPIIADDYADPEKGTGAVKITPAHDFNDFQVGKRHDLPMINILDPVRPAERRTCRRPTAAWTASPRARRSSTTCEALGLLRGDREDPPRWCRTATAPAWSIEPYLTDQWYVDAKTLAQPAIRRWRRAAPSSSRRTGRRPTSSGCATSSPGASRASSGGATASRPGTARTATIFVEETEAAAQRRGARALRPRRAADARTRTCSTPGSPRRCGRSRPWAGRTRPPT